MVTTCFYY